MPDPSSNPDALSLDGFSESEILNLLGAVNRNSEQTAAQPEGDAGVDMVMLDSRDNSRDNSPVPNSVEFRDYVPRQPQFSPDELMNLFGSPDLSVSSPALPELSSLDKTAASANDSDPLDDLLRSENFRPTNENQMFDIELDLPDTLNQRSRSSSASGKKRGESSDDQDNFQGGYAEEAAPPTSSRSDASPNGNIKKFKEYFRNGHLFYIAFPRRGRRGKKNTDNKLYALSESTNPNPNPEEQIAIRSKFWAQQAGGEEWLNELASIANNANCEPEPFFLPSIGWKYTQWVTFLDKECKDLRQKIDAVKNPDIVNRLALKEHNVNLKYHIVFMMIMAKLGKIEFYDIPPPPPPDGDSIDLDPAFSGDTASTFQFIDMAAALPN